MVRVYLPDTPFATTIPGSGGAGGVRYAYPTALAYVMDAPGATVVVG